MTSREATTRRLSMTSESIPLTSIYAPITGPSSAVVGVAVEFTVNLASPAIGNIVLALNSPGFPLDTFQSTFGGPDITSITIESGQSSITFWFTSEGAAGARTITTAATNYYSNPYNFSATAPPPATCEISNAHVTTSGQSIAFFFQTDQWWDTSYSDYALTITHRSR